MSVGHQDARPTPGRRWALIAVIAALAVAAGVGTAVWMRMPGAPAGAPAASRDATALLGVALPDTAGREQKLGQWQGQLLVVNFWATWCAPCREEMPLFIKAQREHGARGIQFVGIAVDEADKVAGYAKEIGLNYPALVGGYGAMELSRTLGNTVMALPFTVVVGRDGKVALTHLGPIKPSQLDRILKDHL